MPTKQPTKQSVSQLNKKIKQLETEIKQLKSQNQQIIIKLNKPTTQYSYTLSPKWETWESTCNTNAKYKYLLN